MPDLKQPAVKADGLMRNTTGIATPAADSEGPGRKASKKKSAAPAKKRVARKKVSGAATAKKTSGKKAAAAAANPEPAQSPAPQVSAPSQKASARPTLSGQARQRTISEAAYLISLKRQAGANGPEADWLYAETVIDMLFDRTD